MKNYSRQRETILQVLHSTDTHPTASAVYNEVRKVIPNISLGTVYRNLAALSEEGVILSLSVGDGYEHFDGNSAPHAHLHCKRCGKIYDGTFSGRLINGIGVTAQILKEAGIDVIGESGIKKLLQKGRQAPQE